MLPPAVLLCCFSLFLLLGVAGPVLAQNTAGPTSSSSSSSTSSDSDSSATTTHLTLGGTVSVTASDPTLPTGSYLTYSTTMTVSDNPSTSPTSALSNTAASSESTELTTSYSLMTLNGPNATTSSVPVSTGVTNATATPSPVINSRPCNGYPEFCARKYSNITMVAAHNSPFTKANNIASNQVLPVESQLNDGIRMLQMQTHFVNNTVYLCHSSCQLLNVGTLESYLTRVTQWLRQNPYDVVTILIGNGDYVSPDKFVDPIEKSGLKSLAYTPPKIPMTLDEWPTISDMIFHSQRAVVFMDYKANQSEYPWLMDEFSQLWETPFSPTSADFPCTVQRPPKLAAKDASQRMYMANHNLNLHVDLNLGNLDLLIPDMGSMVETNGMSGHGSLGAMSRKCTHDWNRPPNFLLVDYYNYGKPNGTTLRVAAEMNNVTYNNKCCGTVSAAPSIFYDSGVTAMLTIVMVMHLLSSFF